MSQYQEKVRRMLRHLTPHRVANYSKKRVGNTADGGYVLIDDFAGVDTVFSFGISDDITFDSAVVEYGVDIYQYDHTVDDISNHPRMHFHKKMISPVLEEGAETISNLIRVHDKGRNRPNIVIKIDIENYEWPCFDATSEEDLSRVLQITGEFHYFENLRDEAWLDLLNRVIKKLTNQFALVHVHANNHAAVYDHDGVIVPNVMEFTFVNREHYEVEPSGELFPGALDFPCNPDRPDIWLGSFRF